MKAIFRCFLKAGDLAHGTKGFDIHLKWTKRITNEFYIQGDMEKAQGISISMLCDRDKDKELAKNQVGFLKYMVEPFWNVAYGLLSKEFNAKVKANIKDNMDCWLACKFE